MGKRNHTSADVNGGHQHNHNNVSNVTPVNKKAKYASTGHGHGHGHGQGHGHGHGQQQHNNQSTIMDDEKIFEKESPKPEFQLSRELVNGTILTDITQQQWRIGNPIGKGSFGEIFLASDNISYPVTNENAKYVVKIEPHSNGPLFVEIHCLLNTAKSTEDNPLPPGMPAYIASGSHYFKNARYRFLVLQRFDRDLHSIIKNRKVDPKSVLVLAVQILEVLEHLHDKGYCHSDIKAENLMISKCTYHKDQFKRKKNKKGICNDISSCDSDSDKADNNTKKNRNQCNSNEEHNVDDDDDDDDDDDVDDDFEEDKDNYAESLAEEYHHTSSSNNKKRTQHVQYGGSNPVRSCRTNKNNSVIYQEMVKTHYLRPTKKINYSQFFGDDTSKSSGDDDFTFDDYITRHRCRLNMKFRNGDNHSKNKTNRTNFIDHNHHHNNKTHKRNNNSKDWITEDRIFLIDFGLASKFIDANGVHRPFCMDQRRAHDGTLEFTSRDAHMGAHSRRSDLECLGYNLIFWSQGYLPWKENAAQQQHEKVHGMKEYLMANVKEMLKHIYGKTVPKYLGEYMHYVGQLAYHERPNYKKCKRIFQREFIQLGYKKNQMQLNVNELIQNSVNVKEEIENNNLFEMKNMKMVKNLGVIMPFRENCNSSNRVSPKNLRSKSDKLSTTKKRKKFSWAEILSQDPDQIARERAEKEFEREETVDDTPIRYKGKPTYAILEIQNRIKFKDRMAATELNGSGLNDSDLQIFKGYTKPMIEILKKRQSNHHVNSNSFHEINDEQQHYHRNKNRNTLPITTTTTTTSNVAAVPAVINHSLKMSKSEARLTRIRAKAGLRTVITPTKRGLDYKHSLIKRRAKRAANIKNIDFNGVHDETSCSSMNSAASSNISSKKSSGVSTSTIHDHAGSLTTVATELSDEDTSHDSSTAVTTKRNYRHVPSNKNGMKTHKIILNGTHNTGSRKLKKRKIKTPKKRETRVKMKVSSNEEADNNEGSGDFSCSDYEYYPAEKKNGNGGAIPVVTFKKRRKRTRSG